MQCSTQILGAVVTCVFIGVVSWGGVSTVDSQGSAEQAGQASSSAATPLTGTHWKLVEMGGMPAVAGEGANEASLELNSDGKLSGSSGCNRLVGTYKAGKNSLRFKPAGLTKMACPDRLMKQEEGFLEVLRQTRSYQITGDALELRDNKDVLARFQARVAK